MIEQYWPFYLGGIGIGTVAVLVLAIGGDYLGVTRGYVSMCSIISNRAVFRKPELGGPFGIRTFFTFGIMIGGFLAAIQSGGWHPTFDFGRFDVFWSSTIPVKAAVLITGGFLWGYGARLAKGCTSGNTISGISRGSLSSIVATGMFMVGGILVFQILNWLAGGKY